MIAGPLGHGVKGAPPRPPGGSQQPDVESRHDRARFGIRGC
jgi:hypothetical protein